MKKGFSYFGLITLALSVSVLIMVDEGSTDPIQPPSSSDFFGSLTTKGEVEIEHYKGGVRENFELKFEFKLDPLGDGIAPLEEDVTIEFDRGAAGIEDPQWLIQIPPTAWNQRGKGYRLASSDPGQSGVGVYLGGVNGTDLTSDITEFEAELKPRSKGRGKGKNGAWDLKIEGIAEGHNPIWSPVMGSAVGTTITIGDDSGVSIAERVEMFQGENPIW